MPFEPEKKPEEGEAQEGAVELQEEVVVVQGPEGVELDQEMAL
jgi:hypothetical protein